MSSTFEHQLLIKNYVFNFQVLDVENKKTLYFLLENYDDNILYFIQMMI